MPHAGFSHESPKNETVEWYTPPSVFEALGLQFDLDPCFPAGKELPWVPAKRKISLPEDGLEAAWEGLVWMNPPYGNLTARWMKKLQEHRQGIALVFARPDTGWFQEAAQTASGVLFIKKRIRFINSQTLQPAEGSPGAGSCLIGFGLPALAGLRRAQDQDFGILMRKIT